MSINHIHHSEKMSDHNHTILEYSQYAGYPAIFLLAPVFAYFGIDQEVFVILCSLMFLDSFLGGIKSHRLHTSLPDTYSKWEWQKFWWGLCVKIMVACLPFLLAILAITFDYDGKWFIDACIKIMIVSEVYSVLGNIYAIKNRKDVKKIDAISVILHTTREALYSWLMTSLKRIEKSKDCNFKDRD
ncbi:hypothetical protein EP331_00170 [bacterium]|nr:MAG: hypothetical protein EP331_00170 [bacterium]